MRPGRRRLDAVDSDRPLQPPADHPRRETGGKQGRASTCPTRWPPHTPTTRPARAATAIRRRAASADAPAYRYRTAESSMATLSPVFRSPAGRPIADEREDRGRSGCSMGRGDRRHSQECLATRGRKARASRPSSAPRPRSERRRRPAAASGRTPRARRTIRPSVLPRDRCASTISPARSIVHGHHLDRRATRRDGPRPRPLRARSASRIVEGRGQGTPGRSRARTPSETRHRLKTETTARSRSAPAGPAGRLDRSPRAAGTG